MPRPKKNKQAGAAFKVLLKEKGFSNSKLAKAIGMGAGHIGRIASGEIASPTPATLEKIAAELGVELGELTMMFAQSSVRSHSAEVPPPEEEAQEETVSKNTDFVGREEAIAHLDNFVNEGAKVILIQAEGGVGKTTLAQKWFEHQGLEPLLLRVGMTPQNIQSAEDWVRHKLIKDFQENPERNFLTMLEQLRVKLQTQRIGLLIDNLEPALINGEFIEPHQSYYVELLTVLAHPTVQSVTLVTSREPLYEPGIMGLQTFQTYLLERLKKKAWEKYFDSQNISIKSHALSEMHRSYGGNALAMHLLSSDIRKQSQGNLEVYWQHNRDDLLKLRSLKSLVKRQFNKLREDNRHAYDLLCRLGFYPKRDVPFVPKAWLCCLLWDVPEKNRQQVIDDLCDRFLVKVSDDRYYLHPVIRAEALDRHEAKSAYLIQIKKQIDLLIAQDREIQNALLWISQKFDLVSKCYKKAAFRAFYLGCIFQYSWSCILSNVDNEYENFENAYLLEKGFLILCGKYHSQKGWQRGIKNGYREVEEINQEIKKIIKENMNYNSIKHFEEIDQKAVENYLEKGYGKYLDSLFDFDEKELESEAEILAALSFELTLKFELEEYRIKTLKRSGRFEQFRNKSIKAYAKGYKIGYLETIKERTLTIEEYKDRLFGTFRDIEIKNIVDEFQDIADKFKWKFRDEQKKLLKQYYDLSRLVVYCLDSADNEVRSYIEENLFLPIDEMKQWTPEN